MTNYPHTVPEFEPREALITKWNLREDYEVKSRAVLLTEVDAITDGISGEVRPDVVIQTCIPKQLALRLLKSPIHIQYDNGTLENRFNPQTQRGIFKATDYLLQVIGQAVWYLLIDPAEEQKRLALVHQDPAARPLPLELIPHAHKKYAALMAAWSGQFLEDPATTDRPDLNRLEDAFARNLSFLLTGRPLEALPPSLAKHQDLLDFYRRHGITNLKHENAILRRKIRETTKNQQYQALRRVSPHEMTLEDCITAKLIMRVQRDLTP